MWDYNDIQKMLESVKGSVPILIVAHNIGNPKLTEEISGKRISSIKKKLQELKGTPYSWNYEITIGGSD